MPLLRGCCCLDLQVGTKIIGVLGVILDLLAILTHCLAIFIFLIWKEVIIQMVAQFIDFQNAAANNRSDTEFFGKEIGNDDEVDMNKNDFEEMLKNHSDMVIIVLAVLLCIQIVDLICCSSLVHGIRKNRRGLLLPWIILNVLYLITILGVIVLGIIGLIMLPNVYPFFLSLIAMWVIWLAIHFYIVLVVISQFQALGLIRMHDEMCMK